MKLIGNINPILTPFFLGSIMPLIRMYIVSIDMTLIVVIFGIKKMLSLSHAAKTLFQLYATNTATNDIP